MSRKVSEHIERIRNGGWIYLLPLLQVLVMSGCAKATYNVSTNCDREASGNYVLKWEVKPALPGEVNIYVSDQPEVFPARPTMVLPIGQNMATIVTSDNMSHKYFLLEFAGQVSTVASVRFFPMKNTFNLRDAGGYDTYDGMYMKWGMLYRSARPEALTVADSITMRQLGIRSIIYLEDEERISPTALKKVPNQKAVSIPADRPAYFDKALQLIYGEKLQANQVRDFYAKAFKTYAFENPRQFSEAFELLLDESNYPILISDALGKDRTSFFVFLIHLALDLPRNVAVEDYLMSNQTLPLDRLIPASNSLTPEKLDALIRFYSSDDLYLNEIVQEIVKRYGDMNNYLEKMFGMTAKKREKLKRILLE